MKKKLNNKGQVTIEFILVFSVSIFFVLSFTYYMINFGIGYLAHYATYAVSRAYLTSDHIGRYSTTGNLRVAAADAVKEFKKYQLESFGVKGELKINSPEDVIYEFVGAYYIFEPPFSFTDSEQNKYISESFLGKEPTISDCECRIQQIMGIGCGDGVNVSKNISDDVTLFDNGC
ncbi:MAG: hypothetical protein H6621_05720 [Halobacteriovoraceae bacterium]|nr:hypothetical protein [Halobacteriovoraceae bacterium]